MSGKLLVAYASRGGSTAAVAEVMGRTLEEYGIAVDVRPVQEVTDVTPYWAVITGSAIHTGEWLPEAMDFVQRHQAGLNQRPFAAFLMCMAMSLKPGMLLGTVKNWMQPVRDLVPLVSEGYFAGVVDPEQVDFSSQDHSLFNMMISLGIFREGDHRDWDALRAWTLETASTLAATQA